jgi:hypothetical protein
VEGQTRHPGFVQAWREAREMVRKVIQICQENPRIHPSTEELIEGNRVYVNFSLDRSLAVPLPEVILPITKLGLNITPSHKGMHGSTLRLKVSKESSVLNCSL